MCGSPADPCNRKLPYTGTITEGKRFANFTNSALCVLSMVIKGTFNADRNHDGAAVRLVCRYDLIN